MSDTQRVGAVLGSAGSPAPFTATISGASRVGDAQARFQDAVLRGNVWLAANQASTALSNLNATCTGLALTNPAGSGMNLVVWEIGIVQTSTATTAVAAIVLAANVNPVAAAVTHTTPLTVRNALLGYSGTSVGLADGAATLPATPVVVRALWAPSVSASATTAIPPVIIDQVDGKLILTPGTAISLSSTTAISVIAHMIWEQVPALSYA